MSSMIAPTIAMMMTGTLKHSCAGNGCISTVPDHQHILQQILIQGSIVTQILLTIQYEVVTWMTLQSKLTENIASDEMYSISKKMLTVNLSSLIGLQRTHQQSISAGCSAKNCLHPAWHSTPWQHKAKGLSLTRCMGSC